MKIKEALEEASKDISIKEAKILLSYLLEKDILWLIMNEDKNLEREDEYFSLVDRVKKSEPIEYITKKVSFYSREFYIDYGALIPRPESELLVDKANDLINKNSFLKVAEIGVGSGIISILLALLNPKVQITASDISYEAINIASKNAKKFKVDDRIRFVHSSYLDGIEDEFDLIVSNPPYIRNSFKLDPKLHYEPSTALYGGEKGDEILKDIIDLSIKKGVKYLCCEMGYDQREAIKSYCDKNSVESLEFYKDLSGLDRGFIAKVCDG